MKLYPGEYTIMDLLAVQRTKQFRVSATPFGLDLTMHRYAGRAVPWKFVKGVENIRKIGGGAAKVADTLETKLIPQTRGYHEKGVVLAVIDGKTVLLPRKALEVARRHGKAVVELMSAGSAAEILTAAAR